MHVQVLASGSRGNSLLVRAGELHVLLDAGLPLEELEERLDQVRVSIGRLDAIALTHGHLDHARASGLLAKKSGATLICCERLMRNNSVRTAPRMRTLTVGRPLEITAERGQDRLSLLGVAIPHDAEPTVAFRIEHRGRVACLVTDLGSPTGELKRRLGDAHLAVLEFNHDEKRLNEGSYPEKLKKRIRSPHGHLSNTQAAECLRSLANPNLHTLVLAHLSRENNTKELALKAAEGVLSDLGEKDVRLLVAEQESVGPNLKV